MINSKAMLLGTFCTLLALNAYADSVGSDYQDFKNSLNKKYGFDYNLDVSVLGQRTSRAEKTTPFRRIYILNLPGRRLITNMVREH